MKYVVGTLVVGLVALALYPVFTESQETEQDRSERAEGGRSFTVDAGRGADPGDQGTEPGNGGVANGNHGQASGRDTETGTPEAPRVVGPGVIKDDPLADVVFGVLRDVITGKVTVDRRADAEGVLEAILEQEKMGTAETRQQAAVVAVSTMFRQLDQYEKVSGDLTDFQVLAIKAQSNEFASDFYRRLPIAGQAGHTGTLRAAVEVEIPAGYERISWETLGGFEYEEGMVLPEAIRSLNKKKVGIAGYMMTLEEIEDIHEFLLIESLWSCCFGTFPETHQVLVITIPADQRGVEYTTAPVLILGELEVGEEVEDGFVTSLYRVKADKVKEVE